MTCSISQIWATVFVQSNCMYFSPHNFNISVLGWCCQAAPDAYLHLHFGYSSISHQNLLPCTLQPKIANLPNPISTLRGIIKFSRYIFLFKWLATFFPNSGWRLQWGVYLGKLMSGHLLSLSRCLLNCKKENRGEYLEGIFAQNIGVTIRQDSAKIANSSSSANPVICGWPVIPAKNSREKKEEERIAQTWPFWQGLNGWWKGRN